MGSENSHPHRNYDRFLEQGGAPLMTLYNEEPREYEYKKISALEKEDLTIDDFENMYAANKLFNRKSNDFRKYSRLLSEMIKRNLYK